MDFFQTLAQRRARKRPAQPGQAPAQTGVPQTSIGARPQPSPQFQPPGMASPGIPGFPPPTSAASSAGAAPGSPLGDALGSYDKRSVGVNFGPPATPGAVSSAPGARPSAGSPPFAPPSMPGLPPQMGAPGAKPLGAPPILPPGTIPQTGVDPAEEQKKRAAQMGSL